MKNIEDQDREFRQATREVWSVCNKEGTVLGTIETDKGRLTPKDVLKDFLDRGEDVFVYQVSCEEEDGRIQGLRGNPDIPCIDGKACEGRRYAWAKIEGGEIYEARVVTTELEIVEPKIVFEKV